MLITDAMAAAGMPDGDYRLGELDVTVSAGVARLTGTTGGRAPQGAAARGTFAGATAPGGTAPGGTAPGGTFAGATPPGSAGAIAGSTATMDFVVRRAITAIGLSVTDVAEAASTTPARRLGLDGVTGSLRAGLAADIALLDSDFRLTAVIARGEIQPASADGPRSDLA